MVNAYFAQYGIRDLDAVRVRYVSTGIVFLLFVALPIYGSLLFWQTAAHLRRQNSRLWLPFIVGGLIVGPASGLWLELTVVARALLPEFSIDAARYYAPVSDPTLVVGLFSVNALVLGCVMLWKALGPHVRAPRMIFLRNLLLAFIVIVGLGVVVIYATNVYGFIPQWLGGGRLESVRLVVTQVIADACPPCASESVLLVDDDSSRVVVIVRQPTGTLRGVVIRGGEVKAIIND